MSTKVVRSVDFLPQFCEDLIYWIKTDRKIALRTMELVEAVVADPFHGIGKPEPLRYEFAGAWSRRITQEHRLICRVSGNRVDFLMARFHYD